jgi:hypothetical protein
MPFFIKDKGFTIGATRKDLVDYSTAYRDGNTTLSFIQYLKERMKVPFYQPVTIEIKYKDRKASAPGYTGTGTYVDLSGANLSSADFSSRDYDGVNSEIIFHKAKLSAATNLETTNFSGTKFEEVRLKDTQIANALVSDDTQLSSIGLSQPEVYQLYKSRLQSEVTEYEYNKKAVDTAIADFNRKSKGLVKKIYTVLKRTASDTVSEEKSLTIDQALISLRAEHIRKEYTEKPKDPTLLEKVEKVALDTISSIYDEKAKAIQSWSGWLKSWKEEDQDRIKVKELVMDLFKEDDFLKKHFLQRDFLSLSDFLEKNIKELHKLYKESPSSVGKKISIRGLIQSWKSSDNKVKRWVDLRQSVEGKSTKLRKKEKTWAETLAEKLPSGISPTEKSLWPRINPLDNIARKRDLELKKEGLRILLIVGAGTPAAASVIAGASGLISRVGGILGGATLSAVGLATYNYLERQMTEENYDQWDSQFGDRLLEIAVAKRACQDSVAFVANNAMNESVINQFTDNPLTSRARTILNPVRAFGQYAMAANASATYEFIQEEKGKVTKNRRRPGDPSFQNELDDKLIHVNKALIYCSLSAVIVGGFIAAAVFAGPAIAPLMATIGALSPTVLMASGVAAIATLTSIGYMVHSKASYYFGKAKSAVTRGRVNVTPEGLAAQQSASRQEVNVTPERLAAQQSTSRQESIAQVGNSSIRKKSKKSRKIIISKKSRKVIISKMRRKIRISRMTRNHKEALQQQRRESKRSPRAPGSR